MVLSRKVPHFTRAVHYFFVAGALLIAAMNSRAIAADPAGYLVLTSDYVYRGVTYSDDNPTVQLGGDISFESGIYVGAWASAIDISNGPSIQRDLEVTYYLGYSHDLGNNWAVGVNAVAFTYPGAAGPFDYDYEEFTVSANYKDRAWLEYSYSPDIFNSSRSTENLALFVEWPLPGKVTLGTGIGRYDLSALSGSGYNYWQIGLTRPLGIFEFDLRYHGTSTWVPIVSTADRADDRLVLSVRLQF